MFVQVQVSVFFITLLYLIITGPNSTVPLLAFIVHDQNFTARVITLQDIYDVRSALKPGLSELFAREEDAIVIHVACRQSRISEQWFQHNSSTLTGLFYVGLRLSQMNLSVSRVCGIVLYSRRRRSLC
jgi:hypothetical protein